MIDHLVHGELSLGDDVATFLAVVEDHLYAREAENSLLIGLLGHRAQGPAGPTPFLARLQADGETLGVAYHSGLNLVVSRGMALATASLVQALQAGGHRVPGVVGPEEDASPIADAWAAASGLAPADVVEQMLYELRTIDWPTGVPGHMRAMADADVEQVGGWVWGFHQDALPHEPYTPQAARDNARARPAQGLTYLWEVDGVAVAMAALSRPTRHGITVNAVYVPPEHRRHGYATALVAALSDEGLRRGKAFCVLYTDLANPTSNAIYQRIGYRPVSRSRCVRFPVVP